MSFSSISLENTNVLRIFISSIIIDINLQKMRKFSSIVFIKFVCNFFLPCRGRGPLKTTMDVINAAKKISEAGINLDKLTRQIADQCPESSTKKDLLAYLQRIALYCHQLNITSKVKADVQNISGELIVSGVSMLFTKYPCGEWELRKNLTEIVN